jgi:hypothetical protein
VYTVPDKIVFKVSHIFYLCVRLALYFGLFPSGAHSSAHLRWLVVWLAICLLVLSIRPPLSIRAHTPYTHTCTHLQNYSEFETGYPNSRKLLVRVSDDAKPAKRCELCVA